MQEKTCLTTRKYRYAELCLDLAAAAVGMDGIVQPLVGYYTGMSWARFELQIDR